MNKSVISVILPCYNVSIYIVTCLNSILKQSYQDFEVICVNDASTDNTLDIIKKYSNLDSRIKIISLAQNGGLANARKIGAKNASGRYIAYIDPDDYIGIDYLKRLYDATQDETVDIVIMSGHYAVYKYFNIEKQTTSYNLISPNICSNIETLYPNFFGQGGSFSLSAWGKLYRTNLLNNIPKIDVFYQEDVILNLYVFKNTKSIKFVNYDQYFYRTGGGSSTNPRYMRDMKKVYQIKKQLLKEYNRESTESRFYIICELKNCFYEYIIRLINAKTEKTQIFTIINEELKDPIYKDIILLKEWGNNFYLKDEFQSIINNNSVEILNIALRKNSLKRRLKSTLTNLFGY